MFGRRNVYAMVNGFKVRVKDARQQDRNHLVEVDWEVPLTFVLADEIDPKMARDVYEDISGEMKPRGEIIEAVFDVKTGTQLMEVREHPDMDALVKISGVLIRKVCVYRGEGGSIFLGFTTTWTISDYEREAAAMIRKLKTGVYLTCEEQEPNLLAPGAAADDQPLDARAHAGDGDGAAAEAGADDEGPEPARRTRRRGNLAAVGTTTTKH